jgi:hypothetical protein
LDPTSDVSKAKLAHEPGQSVPADVRAIALQLPPHLLDAVDAEVPLVDREIVIFSASSATDRADGGRDFAA